MPNFADAGELATTKEQATFYQHDHEQGNALEIVTTEHEPEHAAILQTIAVKLSELLPLLESEQRLRERFPLLQNHKGRMLLNAVTDFVQSVKTLNNPTR